MGRIHPGAGGRDAAVANPSRLRCGPPCPVLGGTLGTSLAKPLAIGYLRSRWELYPEMARDVAWRMIIVLPSSRLFLRPPGVVGEGVIRHLDRRRYLHRLPKRLNSP